MAKMKKTNRQTIARMTQHITIKNQQHEPHQKLGVISGAYIYCTLNAMLIQNKTKNAIETAISSCIDIQPSQNNVDLRN